MRGWLVVALVAGLCVAAPAVGRGASGADSDGSAVLVRETAGGAPQAGKRKDAPAVTRAGSVGDFRVASRTDGVGGSLGGNKLVGVDDAPSAAAKPADEGKQAGAAAKPADEGKKAAAAAKPAATAKKAAVAPKPFAPAPATSPTPGAVRPFAYKPVTDGGGLELYLANLARPGSQAGGSLDERIAEFTASKNRYSIEVRLSQRRLYLYENLPDGSRHLARSYTVAVPGRDMEAPQGWGVVTGISFEPWWRPTAAMKERARKQGKELPEVVKPGVKENPMGPFKIILSHGFGFRIHGNNNPGSIGRPVTSGCIRMRNDEGKDMARMIDVGTEVVFLQ
ncbi:MAG: L,D-transpeptidase [Solidesulfovibrio sp. DCME]|uniref:L,D-transpeptidase n=1 Tax=Solidesulfovibrio sp. DCME TaxID=3447380 RepID=UPI003D100EAB